MKSTSLVEKLKYLQENVRKSQTQMVVQKLKKFISSDYEQRTFCTELATFSIFAAKKFADTF